MSVQGHIQTTFEGPFKPVTIPLDETFRGNAIDLPDNDPRVVRIVNGFQPEQISLSLSSTFDSIWVSWVTVHQFTKVLRECRIVDEMTSARFSTKFHKGYYTWIPSAMRDQVFMVIGYAV